MPMTAEWDFTKAAGSTKPVLAVVLATGVGVAAFASPLAAPPVPPDVLPHAVRPLHDAAPIALFHVSPMATLAPPAPQIGLKSRKVFPKPEAATPPRAPEPVADSPADQPPSELFQRTFFADPGLSVLTPPPAAEVEPASVDLTSPPAEPPALIPVQQVAQQEVGEVQSLAAASQPQPLPQSPSPLLVQSQPLESEPARLIEPPKPVAPAAVPFVAAVKGSAPVGLVTPVVRTRKIAPTAVPAPPVAEPERPAMVMPAAELKAMMLAQAAGLASAQVGQAVVVGIQEPPSRRFPGGISRYSQTAQGIAFDIAAQVNGAPAGKLPLLIDNGGEMSVRLGDVLALLRPMMDGAAYEALATSQAAGEYLSFSRLRASGLTVRFDAYDRLILGSK